jgi:hypothetical protein
MRPVLCVALMLALAGLAAAASCNSEPTCLACTSCSGDCRWCFRDKLVFFWRAMASPPTHRALIFFAHSQCHAYGSMQNPCSVAEDITDPADCSNTTTGYDPDAAYKMAMLSAVAYCDDPQSCMRKNFATDLANFTVVGMARTVCDWCVWNGVCAAG